MTNPPTNVHQVVQCRPNVDRLTFGKRSLQAFMLRFSNSKKSSAKTVEDDASVSTTSTLSSAVRGVAFCESVKQYPTLSRKDYTQEEANATWCSKDEYTMILKSCKKQVQKMNQGKDLLDIKYCSRGLERHTPAGQRSRSQNKKQGVHAVIKEQLRQSINCSYDEDAIAIVYMQVTLNCQSRAGEVGRLDRHAVEEYLASPWSNGCKQHQDKVATNAKHGHWFIWRRPNWIWELPKASSPGSKAHFAVFQW